MAPPAVLVLDTNTLFDWLVFGDPAAVAVGHAVRSGRARWLCSEPLWAECSHTLTRPIGPRWELARQLALTNLHAMRTCAVFVTQPVAAPLRCRDADDQKFLDLALAHPGCALLSRDKALLRLTRRAQPLNVRILTPTQWVASGGGSGAAARPQATPALRESPH